MPYDDNYVTAPWNADPDYLSFARKWTAGVSDLSIRVVTLCHFKPTLGTKARKEDLVSTVNLPLYEGKQSQHTLFCIFPFQRFFAFQHFYVWGKQYAL